MLYIDIKKVKLTGKSAHKKNTQPQGRGTAQEEKNMTKSRKQGEI